MSLPSLWDGAQACIGGERTVRDKNGEGRPTSRRRVGRLLCLPYGRGNPALYLAARLAASLDRVTMGLLFLSKELTSIMTTKAAA